MAIVEVVPPVIGGAECIGGAVTAEERVCMMTDNGIEVVERKAGRRGGRESEVFLN